MADSDRGAQLAASCAFLSSSRCRDDGIPPGRSEWIRRVSASALLAYKSGQRESQIMHAVATSLSDDEIAIVTRYLARRERTASSHEILDTTSVRLRCGGATCWRHSARAWRGVEAKARVVVVGGGVGGLRSPGILR